MRALGNRYFKNIYILFGCVESQLWQAGSLIFVQSLIFVVACEIFCYGTWDLVSDQGSTQASCHRRSHWTTRRSLQLSRQFCSFHCKAVRPGKTKPFSALFIKVAPSVVSCLLRCKPLQSQVVKEKIKEVLDGMC